MYCFVTLVRLSLVTNKGYLLTYLLIVSCSASLTWLSVPAVVINSCTTCGILQIHIFRPPGIHPQLPANACSSFQWLTWRWTLPFWLWNCSMHPKHKCKTGPGPAYSGSDIWPTSGNQQWARIGMITRLESNLKFWTCTGKPVLGQNLRPSQYQRSRAGTPAVYRKMWLYDYSTLHT